MPRGTQIVKLVTPVVIALGAAQWAVANPAPSDSASSAAAVTVAPTRLVVAASGNEARYRVRERLAMMELPYDAVGKTSEIAGAIVIDEQGRLVPSQSKITVKMTGLKSEQERRDGFVQRSLLETEKHPNVEIAPTALRGLTGPLPASGSRSFEMVANMTVRGVTKPTVWQVTANFAGGRVTGSATTAFTFADFNIEKPSVPVVLSLADELKLEYDFTLLRQDAS